MSEKWSPKTPYLTVDAVIRTVSGIVLIRRHNKPVGWALPGGFVEIGETVEDAVKREAFEETNLSINNLWLVGVYSEPGRDPRFHTVSVVFGATASDKPSAGDDASDARIFPAHSLPEDIVFDHLHIINDFLKLEQERE